MNIFYIIWFLFPLLYFLIGLWAYLEKKGKSRARQNPGDFFKQGVFLLACVLVSIGIDKYVLIIQAENLPDFLPLAMVRVLLLPVVFILLGLIVGGSTPPSLKKDQKKKKGR